jgi:putative ABC transport system permease protein
LSRRWKKPVDDQADILTVIGKLKPGIPIDRARTEMSALAERLSNADPERYGPKDASVFSIRDEDTSPDVNRALYVLWGAVGFLLLIGCANLANLTLARAMVRTREIAVRRALGASRGRIIRQLFGESLVVSALGAGAGLLVAQVAIRAILALEPPGVQRPEQVGLNLAVFAFVAAASAVTALLFGLAPAIVASRTGVNEALKAGGSVGSSAPRSRGRQILIACEVALALVLVTGAGLLIRSFREVLATDLGYDPAKILSADVDLPEDRYPDPQRRALFFEGLRERARTLPGVTGATIADALPMHHLTFSSFTIVGQSDPDPKSPLIADFAFVNADYFRTFGVPLLAGRDFSGAEIAGALPVAIVNGAFARKFLAGRDPIGQQIRHQDRAVAIVGVAADYREMGAEGELRPQVFRPSVRSPEAMVIVRLNGAAAPAAQALRSLVASTDRELAAGQVRTLQEWNESFVADRRFSTLLLTIFAGLALVLALVGVYSVMTNVVAARTREIGIRLAVGASPGGIGRMVAAQTLRPVVAGLVAGVAGSLAISRVLESMLFQVSARDPLTMILAVVLILGIAPAALVVPLRKAMGVSCTVALRDE